MRPSLLSFNVSPNCFTYLSHIPFLQHTALAEIVLEIFTLARCLFASNMSMYAPFWVENNGFEPLTPCLQSRCSSQLS